MYNMDDEDTSPTTTNTTATLFFISIRIKALNALNLAGKWVRGRVGYSMARSGGKTTLLEILNLCFDPWKTMDTPLPAKFSHILVRAH